MTIRGLDIEPGTIVTHGRSRFEFRRWGCATGIDSCGRKVPVTVARIRRDRTTAPNSMTECYEADELDLEISDEDVAEIVNGPSQ